MRVFVCLVIIVFIVLALNVHTKPPIQKPNPSGAFGWVFGSKLPADCETFPDNDGTFYYTYATNGFFTRITISIDDQRRVCMIRGFVDFSSVGENGVDALIEAMTQKYGLAGKSDVNLPGISGRLWDFGHDQQTRLSILNGEVQLLYRFDPLLSSVQQNFLHQQNQQTKDSIKGI